MSEQLPILDIDALLESVDGDCDLLDDLADTFTAEVPGWISQLRAAVASGDAATTYRVAHGLNGAMSYFKASIVQRKAAELEAMGREANLDDANRALDQLEAALLALRTFLSGTPWRR
jgi:HPt (histidine-containing phosphotransfer) domain-containing protein